MAAIRHRGFALVDILQPCVTFNKLNTFAWYKSHTYPLPATHDPKDREQAFARALETDRIPLGILFCEQGRSTFEDNLGIYQSDSRPLFERQTDMARLRALMEQVHVAF